jgi:hypothetical protein
MKPMKIGAVAVLLAPSVVFAASAFDGTWKADLGNIQLPKKPSLYLLSHGVYRCLTCAPAYTVKADGHDHKVTGHPYFDTVSIKVIDDNTVEETDKKGGKTVTVSTTTVSADGKSATFDVSDSSNSNGAPVLQKGELVRVGKAPPGAHAISGRWRATKFDNISDNGLLVTYALSGSTLKMTQQTGQSYSAPLDGTDAPYTGDPGQSSVSLKRVDDHTIDETDKRDGKVISTEHMTVSADGKSMKVEWKDLLHGSTGSFTNVKQ